jgi:ribonuclease HI
VKEVNIFLMTSTKAPKIEKGEYQYILTCGSTTLKDKGAERQTTGNRLVIRCAIEAMKRMRKPSMITIWTDSGYLISGHENMGLWIGNGWKRPGGRQLKNIDLWKQLHELEKGHMIRCRYEDMERYKD